MKFMTYLIMLCLVILTSISLGLLLGLSSKGGLRIGIDDRVYIVRLLESK